MTAPPGARQAPGGFCRSEGVIGGQGLTGTVAQYPTCLYCAK